MNCVVGSVQKRAYVVTVVRSGVRGYVLRSAVTTTRARAVEAVATAGGWLTQLGMRWLAEDAAAAGRPPAGASLTRRERAVVGLLAQGYRDGSIAAQLGIGERTVRYHLTRVRAKLRAATRAEIVARALQGGLLVPEDEA